jgi:hypothetical protein
VICDSFLALAAGSGYTRASYSRPGEHQAVATRLHDQENDMAKRTTHRSTSGKKLYAKRDAAGKFKDIQTYERAHGQDVKRKSKTEKSKKK